MLAGARDCRLEMRCRRSTAQSPSPRRAKQQAHDVSSERRLVISHDGVNAVAAGDCPMSGDSERARALRRGLRGQLRTARRPPARSRGSSAAKSIVPTTLRIFIACSSRPARASEIRSPIAAAEIASDRVPPPAQPQRIGLRPESARSAFRHKNTISHLDTIN